MSRGSRFARFRDFLTAGSLMLAACLAIGAGGCADSTEEDLATLTEWMTGSFSSQAQAEADTNFFDIRLEMKPIWTDRTDGHWLYVEQAASWALDKPYRQRVYHVTAEPDGIFRSMVFTLPDPEAAIGVWKEETPLAGIGPDNLEEREGCAVYLKRTENGDFVGATKANQCISTLRGATYATSQIAIKGDRIVSWDRGWDAQDKQVWGAETGGYIFIKTE